MKAGLAITASVALLAAIAPPVRAQRPFAGAGAFWGAPGAGSQSHMHGPFMGRTRGRFGRPRFGGRFFNRSGFILPYFYPPDYYGDDYVPPETEAPPPQVLIVKTGPSEVQAPPAPPAASLVLELRDGHWVRITDGGASEARLPAARTGSAQAAARRTAEAEAAAPPRAVPATVLVFRDGRQEQTTRYTIVGHFIYTSTNYWSGGAWTRKFPIAQLDIPATLRANQERGVKFNLPSVPNEIIVRP